MTEDRKSAAWAKLENSDHRCGARWGGHNVSHCTSCHRTFSAVSTFDEHRNRKGCADPESLGMVLLVGRVYDCWGHRAPDELPLAWR